MDFCMWHHYFHTADQTQMSKSLSDKLEWNFKKYNTITYCIEIITWLIAIWMQFFMTSAHSHSRIRQTISEYHTLDLCYASSTKLAMRLHWSYIHGQSNMSSQKLPMLEAVRQGPSCKIYSFLMVYLKNYICWTLITALLPPSPTQKNTYFYSILTHAFSFVSQL